MTSVTPDTSIGSTFRVSLLGPFLLERDGELLATDKWQRRVSSLFKLLILAPHQRRLRDEVIDLFWPDADVSSAAVSLRVAISISTADDSVMAELLDTRSFMQSAVGT